MIAPARRAALDALLDYRTGRELRLDVVIRQTAERFQLSGKDASLAEKIVIGVLQNQSLCDEAARKYSRGKSDTIVAEIIRIAVYQILFLDRVPVSAAVNDAVSSCKWKRRAHSAGYVNALLHRVIEDKSFWIHYPEETLQQICIRYSHPEWLGKKLQKAYGLSFVKSFFAANNTTPPITLQVNTNRIDPERFYSLLRDHNIPFHVLNDEKHAVTITSGDITSLPGYSDGYFYVQDEAASLAVTVLGLQSGMKLLDSCAAPGGKTIAAAIATSDSLSIVAADLSESRLLRLQENISRLHLSSAQIQRQDASVSRPDWISQFDAVIVDVPCSGMGTIRKRPEIRWKEYESVLSLSDLQKSILRTQAQYVKPGGVLLYSTCSVLPEENEEVVLDFLADHPEYQPESFFMNDRYIADGMHTFWPQIDETDGFFVAKLRLNN